jgi:hypothetical protein
MNRSGSARKNTGGDRTPLRTQVATERRRAVGDHCGELIQDRRDLEPTMTIDPAAP